MLADELRLRGVDVLATREPGGTPLGRHLRKAFLETEEVVSPLAELLLFAADRAQHVEFVVKPALAEGRVVISDRFADATYAYQGAGRGFPEDTVNKVIALATGGLKPDLTIFFDLSIENTIKRMSSRLDSGRQQDRMDVENAEFYERVREAYEKLIEMEPERFRVVDANGSVEEIHTEVLKIVSEYLGL